jgi:hypothetical protein
MLFHGCSPRPSSIQRWTLSCTIHSVVVMTAKFGFSFDAFGTEVELEDCVPSCTEVFVAAASWFDGWCSPLLNSLVCPWYYVFLVNCFQ